MSDVALEATMAYSYAGRSLKVGERFFASEKDAALLKVIGRAKDARVLQTRALTPEPPVDSSITKDPEPAQPRAKRQYRRRDLTAEP
jgi:hypothetical protein